jgi:hypothetical protein
LPPSLAAIPFAAIPCRHSFCHHPAVFSRHLSFLSKKSPFKNGTYTGARKECRKGGRVVAYLLEVKFLDSEILDVFFYSALFFFSLEPFSTTAKKTFF